MIIICLFVCCCWYVVMLLSKQKGDKKGGGQKVEQLPAKIRGGSYVSKCENYGAFVVFVLSFLSAKSWVNKWVHSRVNKRSTFGSHVSRHMWTTY